jgi:hypothetical protein
MAADTFTIIDDKAVVLSGFHSFLGGQGVRWSVYQCVIFAFCLPFTVHCSLH